MIASDEHLDPARAARRTRILKVPFIVPFSSIRAIVLWRCIFVRRDTDLTWYGWHVLLAHEMVHVEQWRASPLRFGLWYLWRLLRDGYRQHPAELQAWRLQEKREWKVAALKWQRHANT